jgi:hypothetical protein
MVSVINEWFQFSKFIYGDDEHPYCSSMRGLSGIKASISITSAVQYCKVNWSCLTNNKFLEGIRTSDVWWRCYHQTSNKIATFGKLPILLIIRSIPQESWRSRIPGPSAIAWFHWALVQPLCLLKPKILTGGRRQQCLHVLPGMTTLALIMKFDPFLQLPANPRFWMPWITRIVSAWLIALKNPITVFEKIFKLSISWWTRYWFERYFC